MSDSWMRIIEILGFKQAEKIRFEFGDSVIRIPKNLPKGIIIPMVIKDIKHSNYKEIAKHYNLSESTVRRYEKWKIINGNLISPSGQRYEMNDNLINGDEAVSETCFRKSVNPL
jgi:Mor family transcriptional regulator